MEWKKDLVNKIAGSGDLEQVKWVTINGFQGSDKFKEKVAEMSEEYAEVLSNLSQSFI